MMKRIFCIARKDWKEILRDKTCIVLLLSSFLVFPLIHYGMAFLQNGASTDRTAIRTAVVSEDDCAPLKARLLDALDVFHVELIEADDPFGLLRSNQISTVIQIKSDRSIRFLYHSKAYFSFMAASALAERVQQDIMDQQRKADPNFIVCTLEDDEGRGTNRLAESLISMVAPFLIVFLFSRYSTVFANDLFAGEKEKRTLELLFLSGVGKRELYFGKTFVLLLIAWTEIAASLCGYVLSARFGGLDAGPPLFQSLDSPQSRGCVFLSLFSLSTFSVFLASFISLLANSRRAAQMVNDIVASLPALCAVCLMLGIIPYEKSWYPFIPVLNSISLLVSAFHGNGNFPMCFIALIVNLAVCALLADLSNRYMQSDIVFSS